MKHATVEDIITSLPHPILPIVLPYNSCHPQAKAHAIDSHLAGGALGHLGILVSVAAYTVVAPVVPWENPAAPAQCTVLP
jgi:hypothetical protein